MLSHAARLTTAADLVPLLDQWSQQLAWSEKSRFQIELALEELIVNTLTHGRPTSQSLPALSPLFIDVRVEQVAADLVITIVDNGLAFDPTQATAPDITLSAEDRKVGGLGLFFASKMMDAIDYRRYGDRNHVTLRKRLSV